jgi:hypothetical protein
VFNVSLHFRQLVLEGNSNKIFNYLLMKKVVLFFGLAFCMLCASAQAQKEAKDFAPQAGDIALSVSADPFLNYLGNLFGASATAPTFNSGVIRGRYFLSEKNAIRVSLAFDFDKNIEKELTDDVRYTGSTSPPPQVEDVTTASKSDFALGVGYEFRRGTRRLQGFYGADVLFAIRGGGTDYKYGNALSADNPAYRPTESKYGASFGVGLNGFVGAEYFVAPRISLGAEVGLSMLYQTAPKGKASIEGWDGSKVDTRTVEQYTDSGSFKFSTNPINNGQIFVSFYF